MPATRDDYQHQELGINTPSSLFDVLAPDDDNDLPRRPKYILIGATGGDLVVQNAEGTVVTIEVLAGQRLDIRPKRLMEATVATPIVGCF